MFFFHVFFFKCLRVFLFQQIQVKKGDGEAATCPTMVCSVTMWKEEYHPDQWRILIQSPVKYAKQTLGSELSAAILNPWGRSFKNGKISVTPPEAISVQFHCEVHRSQLPDVLRISGYNKLHMIPKTAEGKASPDYSVIWLDGTMQELQAKASMLPGHAGFVKSKKRHGARFESTAFETAWRKLKPGEDMPDTQIYADTYRVQPLPYGVDATVLKTWAANAGWTIKPLKNQGPSRWLVAAQAGPPESWMTFNGQAILIQKMPPKMPRGSSTVLYGAKPFRPAGKQTVSGDVTASEEANPYRQGDPHFDPWQSALASTPLASTDCSTAASASQMPLPGPTAQAILRQDQRIANLEQKLQESQAQQTQHQSKVETRLKDMESSMHNAQTAHQQEMDSLRQDFRSTLREATDRQQDSLQAALVEFKMLFLNQGTKRNRPRSNAAS